MRKTITQRGMLRLRQTKNRRMHCNEASFQSLAAMSWKASRCGSDQLRERLQRGDHPHTYGATHGGEIMRRMTVVAFGLLALAAASPAKAQVEAGELEHARANARAGGPVSERDAELLQRWGCTSGTRSPACGSQYDNGSARYYRPRHRHRRN